MNLPYFPFPQEGASSTDIQATGIWNTGAALDKLLKQIEKHYLSQGQFPQHACDHLRTNKVYNFNLYSGITHIGKIVSDGYGWLVVRKDNLSTAIISSQAIESITPANPTSPNTCPTSPNTCPTPPNNKTST